MPIPESLNRNLALPVICAPMFIVSNPDLVIAQCKAGLIGSFPALNARPMEVLDDWLTRIKTELAADPNAAPFAVNQIIHPSNERLEHDMALCVKHEVPLIITSLSAPTQIVPPVHAYGGKVFHDVISVRHAEKALEAGVDGLILVCAGAGGHANGSAILAAQAMGADFAYIGTRFIATAEAHALDAYKQAIVDSAAVDVVYTPYFTGVHGNYLKKSIVAAGLDPANLPEKDKTSMNFGGATAAKAWKDIWGAGQGVGTIDDVMPTADLAARLKQEYKAAKTALCSNPF